MQQDSVRGNKVEVWIGSEIVEGIITKREARGMTVEITSPYSGLADNSGYIPLGLSQYKNFLNKEGDEKAIEILKNLYHFAKNVETNKSKIAEAVNLFIVRVQDLESPDSEIVKEQESLRIAKTEIRRRFKAKEIDNREYQSLVGPVNKQIADAEFRHGSFTRDLFTEHFEKYRDTDYYYISAESFVKYLMYESLISQEDFGKYFKDAYI